MKNVSTNGLLNEEFGIMKENRKETRFPKLGCPFSK